MAAVTRLLEEIRGEKAPETPYDPRTERMEQRRRTHAQRNGRNGRQHGASAPPSGKYAKRGWAREQAGQGGRLRHRLLGHGLRHGPRRRGLRGRPVGPPRPNSSRPSTPPAPTPTTCPGRTPRRPAGHHRPRRGRARTPTSPSSPSPRRRCAATSPTGRRCSRRDAVLVSLMKGVELGTAKRMSEVIEEVAKAGRGAGRRASPAPTSPGRSPPGSRPPPSSPAPTRRSPAAPGRLPHPVLPPVHQHRRGRLRAGRRGEERHRRSPSASPTAWASATTPRRR